MKKILPEIAQVYARLGFTLVVIPSTILFFHFFHGPTVTDAWRQIVDVFLKNGGPVWIIILGSAIVFSLYLYPAFEVAERQKCLDPIPDALVKKAFGRINQLPLLLFFLNAFSFLSGAYFEIITGYTRAFGSVGSTWLLIEAAISAFASSSLMLLHLDTYLFPVKRRILALNSGLLFRYTSLYGRILLGLTGLVFFLFFQSLSTSSNFLLLGTSMSGVIGAGVPRVEAMRPDAILNSALGIAGMREAVQVVGIRSLLFFSLAVDTLYLIKTMIKSPLTLIQKSLSGLTQDNTSQTPTLDLVNNDEFRPVFSQINQLIQRQKGALEESRAHLDDIVRGAPDPILSFTPDGKILLANPGAQDFFGLSSENLGKLTIDELFVLDTDTAKNESGLGAFLGIIEASGTTSIRIDGWNKDRVKVPLEAKASLVRTSTTSLYTLIVRDVRSQVETERVLREARIAAEKANSMKSEFLANMSHELRTPLNAVLGFTQLLEGDQNLTPGQKEKLGIISRSGEHLLGLINDILDISKIEAGKFELHPVTFDLRQLAEDMKEMFELRASSKGLVLDMEFVEPCPRYVIGDLGKLRQVLINLLGNAVKFTDSGGLGLVVGTEEDRISFVVRDTGRGIPEGDLEQILQPFSQSSLNQNEGGTGLGLAISQRFVDMMGGSLTIESTLGQGSIFRFSLPLTSTDSAPRAERVQRTILSVRSSFPVKALIVDDKQPNRLVLKEMLEKVGFSCMEAENGQEAVERFSSYGPTVVFMDIKMPVMDGYQAAQKIRQVAGGDFPIFALTASAFIHDEQKIRQSGFTDYLSKPFKQASIFDLLERHTSLEFDYAQNKTSNQKTSPITLESLDFPSFRPILPSGFLESLEDMVVINDFSGIRTLVDGLQGPGFDSLKRYIQERVSQFDEQGLDSFIQKARSVPDET